MRTEGDKPSKRLSTKLCEPCRQAGKECFLDVEKWGGDDLRFSCHCGNSFTLNKKTMEETDTSYYEQSEG
jgi:hypothetical protein